MKHSWQEVTLKPDASLGDALNTINQTGLRVALVIDDERKLLGTITDGDIRRAILKHVDLQLSVSQVMNTQPKVASPRASRSQLLALMKKDQLLSIPVVDEDKTLIDLASWHQLVANDRYDNPVFLMAGGFGTRLKPLTNACPKPMLKVGGKPMLEKIIESFIKSGFHRFYISTHYMPEMITEYFGDGSDWGISIEYVHEENPLGTGGALGLLPDDMPQLPIIMMNGDVLTNVDFEDLLSFHKAEKSICTMCVCEYEYQVPYGVIQAKNQKVIDMVEKPVHKYFVNAGIYVVEPEMANKVKKNQAIDMPTLIEQQLRSEIDVSLYPIHEYWKDIGQIRDFNQAQDDINSLDI
ncbi:nucleotidyltransferase family protein [Thalassotalea sp. LPB0316]|uniref:nucleotidyltransferase family protein n=1 Tax=Thalassotalea sp. LPB0316 TaxID=2769490 RepID=UPI0018676B94|nr:nucleotidyltransferase family protein [Thalassotalea sp. LPB0316]QOL27083.1 nucleotidyltransferase family protein [Thalassotalea sp. LPB0316]